jgi:hypothetical protein
MRSMDPETWGEELAKMLHEAAAGYTAWDEGDLNVLMSNLVFNKEIREFFMSQFNHLMAKHADHIPT